MPVLVVAIIPSGIQLFIHRMVENWLNPTVLNPSVNNADDADAVDGYGNRCSNDPAAAEVASPPSAPAAASVPSLPPPTVASFAVAASVEF